MKTLFRVPQQSGFEKGPAGASGAAGTVARERSLPGWMNRISPAESGQNARRRPDHGAETEQPQVRTQMNSVWPHL